MIIDSSAIIGILKQEAEATQLSLAIETNRPRLLSVASWLETSIVVQHHQGHLGLQILDELIECAEIELVSVSIKQIEIARKAFLNYGKGRHPAKLNFGDCFSYALAKTTGQSLLFKGNDFNKTDIQCCIVWD